eukprot:7387531-Prymnesium_polylepis.1
MRRLHPSVLSTPILELCHLPNELTPVVSCEETRGATCVVRQQARPSRSRCGFSTRSNALGPTSWTPSCSMSRCIPTMPAEHSPWPKLALDDATMNRCARRVPSGSNTSDTALISIGSPAEQGTYDHIGLALGGP